MTNLFHQIKNSFENYFFSTLSVISPVLETRVEYFLKFKKIFLKGKPRTFNEKILWLKLFEYNNNPLITQCADKYLVRQYIEDKGCKHLLNELYYVWDTPNEIQWSILPEQFVLKCNHGCGYNLICQSKELLDESLARQCLDKWYKSDFWKYHAELQYREIPKKIICEKFLFSPGGLIDYKIYCFNGKARYILVCTKQVDEQRKFYFFNQDWEFCPITRDGRSAKKGFMLSKPVLFEDMINYSEILAQPFKFVRVDFYDVDGKIIFGELTFTPSAGLDTGRLEETDIFFGELLNI